MIKIKIYHDIQLSFGASDVKRTVIKQNSEDTHVLRIKLYDKQNNEMTIGSNWDITISAVKGDKTHILNTNNISVANNTIQVTMTKQMLTASGTEKCELIIQDGELVLFSDTFLIYVEPNVQDGSSIESIDEYDSIVDSINKVKGYEKEALTAKDHVVTVSNEVDVLKKDIENTYDELEEAVSHTNDLIAENEVIKQNEADRVNAENKRVTEFDKIKNDAQTEITKLQNVNVEAIEGQESYQVKVTDKDGNSKTSDNLLNKISIGTVDKGDYNESPSATITGEFGNQKLNLRLPTGNPFIITNTYSSISEMEADKDNIDLYDFVMINTGSVEDEDTGKLYMKDKNGMMFITDLSGVQGIQGVKGDTGETPQLTIGTVITGDPGTQASATITGTKENPIINLTIPRGEKGTIDNISASSIPYNDSSDTDTVKDVVDKLQNDLGDKANINHTHDDRYYTETEIDTKLFNYENQNAFSNIAVGSETISADNETDTLTLEAGENVTITPDEANNKVIISSTDTVYTHPTTSGNKHIPSGGKSGQTLFWSDDGTAIWGDITPNLIGAADNITYDEDTGELCLKSGDKVLSTVTVEGGGGGGGISLAEPTNVSLANADESAVIKWTDPSDIEVSGVTLATWSGTLVVRKVGSAPTSKTDGVVVVDSKTRNQYSSTGFTDTGLTNGTKYYYGIFPYTVDNNYTYSYSASITPSAIYPSAPTGVSLTAGNGEIKVSFTKPSNATGIRIVYGTTSPTSETDGTIVNTTTSPYTISNLTNDTLYYVRVYSYNAKGRFTASSAVSATPKSLQLVPWSTGTDAQIKAMVDGYYAGDITLTQIKSVWSVGDTRNITLSAMEATGVGESHAEQTVGLTIIDFNHDDLATSVNGKTKALVTVQLKNCLNEKGYMNSTNTNSGGWEGSARRTWCNNTFKSSIPSSIQSLIRNVNKKNYKVYNSTTLSTTSDSCFLLSETEIFGSNTYSAGATEGTQYEYYKTSSNRVKQANGSNYYWWERSPRSGYSGGFCIVNSSGSAGGGSASYAYGLAPGFCF